MINPKLYRVSARLAGEPRSVEQAFSITFKAMGAPCELRLCAETEAHVKAWADVAIAEVRRIEARFSRYQQDSIVSRINAAAGRSAIAVDDETAALLDFGAVLYGQSGARFDLTSGVLRRAWNFAEKRVPDADTLAALRPLIGWPLVQWQRPWVRLPLAGMEIDFGGIGKEYAADRAAACLSGAGARHGFVNLGGDIRAIGPHPDGTPWHIGIRHPRAPEGQAIGALNITTGAVATSGDYERYFELDGRRYCHIFDPRSGLPVSAWQCVSVAMPACVAAGACSTIAMLMQGAEALEFLEQQGCAFLAVDADGRVHRN